MIFPCYSIYQKAIKEKINTKQNYAFKLCINDRHFALKSLTREDNLRMEPKAREQNIHYNNICEKCYIKIQVSLFAIVNGNEKFIRKV